MLRCVTHLVPAYCLQCWYDYVQRCSLNVLSLFSLNIILNIEESPLYMHYYQNCTIGGVCITFIRFNCLTTTVLSMIKCQYNPLTKYELNTIDLFVLTIVYGSWHLYQCRAKMANRHCICDAKIVSKPKDSIFTHKL